MKRRPPTPTPMQTRDIHRRSRGNDARTSTTNPPSSVTPLSRPAGRSPVFRHTTPHPAWQSDSAQHPRSPGESGTRSAQIARSDGCRRWTTSPGCPSCWPRTTMTRVCSRIRMHQPTSAAGTRERYEPGDHRQDGDARNRRRGDCAIPRRATRPRAEGGRLHRSGVCRDPLLRWQSGSPGSTPRRSCACGAIEDVVVVGDGQFGLVIYLAAGNGVTHDQGTALARAAAERL